MAEAAAQKKGELRLLKDEAEHYEPKRWLREVADRLDQDFPNARELVLVVSYDPRADKTIAYAKTSNNLRRDTVLWLLEMGRLIVLKPEE